MKRWVLLAVLTVVLIAAMLTYYFRPVAALPTESYGLMIVVDGARGDLWRRYAEEGRLPNVKRIFIDGGAWVDHATTTFPTITGAGMPAVLTGSVPGRHGIPSLYFFDREKQEYPVLYVPAEAMAWNRWLSPDVKTIWEHFPGDDDALSFGPALSRGADSVVPVVWGVNYKPIELRTKLQLALRKAERVATGGAPARISVVYNGWFDHQCHQQGATAAGMDEHYTAIDEAIGEAVRVFEETLAEREQAVGQPVERYIALASDHGHQDITTVHSLDDFIRGGKGAKVLDKIWLQVFDFRLAGTVPESFDDREIVIAAGEGHALLYFPTPTVEDGVVTTLDWGQKPSLAMLRDYPYRDTRIDIIGLGVAETGSVGFLLGKDQETGLVHVYGEPGEATIERDGPDATRASYRYTVVEGADPLGYAEDPRVAPLLDGAFHHADDWQRASFATEAPDAVVQLYQAFDVTDRAPDLYLSARPGVSIGDLVDGEKSASKHGGLTKEEAWAVVAFAGTGIAPQQIETARNIDVVPTMLTLLQQPYDPEGLDGRVLELR